MAKGAAACGGRITDSPNKKYIYFCFQGRKATLGLEMLQDYPSRTEMHVQQMHQFLLKRRDELTENSPSASCSLRLALLNSLQLLQ